MKAPIFAAPGVEDHEFFCAYQRTAFTGSATCGRRRSHSFVSPWQRLSSEPFVSMLERTLGLSLSCGASSLVSVSALTWAVPLD